MRKTLIVLIAFTAWVCSAVVASAQTNAGSGTGLSSPTSGTALGVPTCADTGGNHLNFSGGVFTCGTSSSLAAGPASPYDLTYGGPVPRKGYSEVFGGTSNTLTVPPDWAANDQIYIFEVYTNVGTGTTPTGFSVFENEFNINGGGSNFVKAFTRTMVGGDTSFTAGVSGGALRSQIMFAIRPKSGGTSVTVDQHVLSNGQGNQTGQATEVFSNGKVSKACNTPTHNPSLHIVIFYGTTAVYPNGGWISENTQTANGTTTTGQLGWYLFDPYNEPVNAIGNTASPFRVFFAQRTDNSLFPSIALNNAGASGIGQQYGVECFNVF